MEALIVIGLICFGFKWFSSSRKPASIPLKKKRVSSKPQDTASVTKPTYRGNSTPTYKGLLFAQPGEVGELFAYGSYQGAVELEGTYSLIDLETSGFNPPHAKILEIAVLKIDVNGQVIDEFSTLIDPTDGEVGRSDIHGITLSMLKNAPTFADAMGPILKIIQNSILVAHNAKFEENFLASEFKKSGVRLPLLPALDTLWLSRQVLDLPNYKLDTIITNYNERIDNAHTALGDVRAMAKVLPRMIEQSQRVLFPRPFSELPIVSTNFKGKQR